MIMAAKHDGKNNMFIFLFNHTLIHMCYHKPRLCEENANESSISEIKHVTTPSNSELFTGSGTKVGQKTNFCIMKRLKNAHKTFRSILVIHLILLKGIVLDSAVRTMAGPL